MGPLGELLADRGTHRIGDLHQARSGHIYIHDVTQLEISSTEIRELVAAGRDPRFLMPDSVRAVIEESGCYGSSGDEVSARGENGDAEVGGEAVRVKGH
jgi:nicotinate-nucleotide adenylyltransferase